MEKPKDNNLSNIKEGKENNSMDEFNFILNRSEKIIKIKNINNKVKEINYTFSSEENYSDEILNYLTQTIDKINQYKYNLSLNNSNSNNNFKIYSTDYITDIDAFYQYELVKKKIHYNQKAFNVHENRKIPYEEQNRQFHRRTFKDINFQNNYFHKNNNRRNFSVDIDNRNNNEEKNNYKEKVGGIPEFRITNNDNNIYRVNNNYEDCERGKSMDRINFRNNFNNKNRHNYFKPGLTSYNPPHRGNKKNFRENDE